MPIDFIDLDLSLLLSLSLSLSLSLGIFDHDNSGTIGLHEFAQLWAYINQWKGVFDRYDKDRSGNIDAGELYTGKGERENKDK